MDFLSLIGDSADNIDGIYGVGEKTAVKWLQEFESIDNDVNNNSPPLIINGWLDNVTNGITSNLPPVNVNVVVPVANIICVFTNEFPPVIVIVFIISFLKQGVNNGTKIARISKKPLTL